MKRIISFALIFAVSAFCNANAQSDLSYMFESFLNDDLSRAKTIDAGYAGKKQSAADDVASLTAIKSDSKKYYQYFVLYYLPQSGDNSDAAERNMDMFIKVFAYNPSGFVKNARECRVYGACKDFNTEQLRFNKAFKLLVQHVCAQEKYASCSDTEFGPLKKGAIDYTGNAGFWTKYL